MTEHSALRLEVSPRTGPLSRRREIRVSGAVPGSIVTIRSATQRPGGTWSAQARFLADDAGTVDLSTSAPVSGDYRVADPMGPFWAQQPEGAAGPLVGDDARVPLRTRLSATMVPGTGLLDGAHPTNPGAGSEADGIGEAHAEVEQWLLSPTTERIEVREDGLVGTLFRPAGPGPFPTIIVLNGSGGGINEHRAALYAERGIQALALGYFRAEGLPRYISRTPLEYFERGLDYVVRTCDPLGGRPLVSGQSRGGELTLLLASRFPEKIAGVVAFVPGAFVFGAQGAADPAEGWDGPTWTSGGEPLEHFWHANAGVTWQPWDGAPRPHRHTDVFIDGLRDRDLARATRIPIEAFDGPVACVSGLDDRAWPSSLASRLVMSTLERHGHAAERLHLDYEAAGHTIGVPFLPATRIEVTHPVSGTTYSNGGTPAGNARASEDSFERVCEFIHRSAADRPR
ncbi:palmitoyl-CoA hydrolase [Pseudactinotalea sp. HY160]|uniref:acyl-CoA thioester hydrolase/BAAT C-terminal domain-containing protein n=1 Tax=Pseudactinotalea sp. HY160 TaxID=2654490 RepID=UPI00128DF163|nr:acyl-CoA thioester hydrolase/BAAT C-terminal domain-containing protein [Pseudactinotalea sp. HY160]MPV49120.1 palmitoyl-CoA hydrolase [Pseudactinotalea sp. HY160]